MCGMKSLFIRSVTTITGVEAFSVAVQNAFGDDVTTVLLPGNTFRSFVIINHRTTHVMVRSCSCTTCTTTHTHEHTHTHTHTHTSAPGLGLPCLRSRVCVHPSQNRGASPPNLHPKLSRNEERRWERGATLMTSERACS
jgi:hypothetical protein